MFTGRMVRVTMFHSGLTPDFILQSVEWQLSGGRVLRFYGCNGSFSVLDGPLSVTDA